MCADEIVALWPSFTCKSSNLISVQTHIKAVQGEGFICSPWFLSSRPAIPSFSSFPAFSKLCHHCCPCILTIFLVRVQGFSHLWRFSLFSSRRLTKYGRSFHRRWLTLPALLPRGPHFPVTQGWQIWSSSNRKWSPVTQHVFLLCPHLQLYFPLSFLYSKKFRKRDDPQISPSVGPW